MCPLDEFITYFYNRYGQYNYNALLTNADYSEFWLRSFLFFYNNEVVKCNDETLMRMLDKKSAIILIIISNREISDRLKKVFHITHDFSVYRKDILDTVCAIIRVYNVLSRQILYG